MERIPPQNLEAEQSLLGALLIDKDAMIRVGDCVHADDFYRDAHREIFSAMVALFERREPIDLLSLSNKLNERGKLESVGGRSAIVELSTIVPTAAHARHYAEIVAKKATLRRLIHAASEITTLGFHEDEDAATVLDEAERRLFAVSQQHLNQAFTPIQDILSTAFDRIDELHRQKGKLRGLPTGFTDLDKLLAGLQESDLVILAARPSVGKTSLAMDIARHAAINQKKPVGVFSLEMSKEQLVDRLICTQANVELWRMRTGNLSDRPDADDFPRIGNAMGVLSEAPIFIDDSAMTNIMEIRTKARRLQMEHGLGLIVVDYLQLMEGRSKKAENRVTEVAEISRGLKGIARELHVPVLALSQLSRAVEMSKPAIPKLAHLRESGAIEQDADVVLFIYRKAADRNYRMEDLTPEDRHTAEIHIAKHRNGPTGVVKLFFDDARVCFRNLEKNRDMAAVANREFHALSN
ncbi:MAG: replicative DNA helicase [bacterium]|nr:replicative DNA helicase [bacterium]